LITLSRERSTASSNRRFSVALAAIAAVLVLAGATAPAHAASGPFCPPVAGNTIGLNAYSTPGDRCAHAFHNGVDLISYHNRATSVMKCAVLKPNSDGSGGNVGGLAAACAPGTDTAIQFPPNLNGYSTGINQGANFHTGFRGTLSY
jgi:hypothetical protein